MVETLKAEMVSLTERIEEKKKAKEKQTVLTEQILTLKKR